MLRNAILEAAAPNGAPGLGPTWEDLEAGGPTALGLGPRGSLAIPSDEKDASLAKIEPSATGALHSRRPWLQTANSSLSSKKVSRARSLPGQLSPEQMREWNEADIDPLATPGLGPRIEEASVDKLDEAGRLPNFSPEFLMSSTIPMGSIPRTSPSSPSRASLTLPTSYLDPESNSDSPAADLYPPARTSWGDNTRGTVSLDIARPLRNSRSPGGSGREIADDADEYAHLRGARRPDYGRFRGESRAALLGRPTEDDLSSDGGSLRRL